MTTVAIRREVMDLLKALDIAQMHGHEWSSTVGNIFAKNVIKWAINYHLIEANTIDGEATVYRITLSGQSAMVSGETAVMPDEETVPQYPDWQITIREAQAKQNIIRSQKEETERQAKAAKDAEHGRDLARALEVAFGIKIEPPATSRVEIDGYIFSLKTYRGSSDWDDRLPTFSEKTGIDPLMPTITFTVYVGIKRPDNMEDWEGWPKSIDFSSTNSPLTSDWTVIRAQLANALDTLKESADYAIKQFTERQKRISNAPSKELTFDDLINRNVNKAVEKATEYLRETDY